MAAPKKTTKAAPPTKDGSDNVSVIFRLSPRAAAKIKKLPRGSKSATVSKLIEQGL